MLEPVALPVDVAEQVERLKPVDFVVGIASRGNAGTIGGGVRAAWAGLGQSLPGARVAVVQADFGASDGTLERAREALPRDELVQVTVTTDRVPRLGDGSSSRADALRVIFSIPAQLGARGCAMLEPDVTNVTPDRVARLLGPLESDQADFVTPSYARHRFTGAVTTSIVYPYVRALYGKRLRYPAGGEFACSSRLLQRFLAADIWRTQAARLGIDVGIAIQALTGSFRLTQVLLAEKSQLANDGLDLAGTLSQVLGALFGETERTMSVWQKVRGSEPVPVRHANGVLGGMPPGPVNRTRSLDAFRLGAHNLQEVWSPVISPMAQLELQKLARLPDESFRFPDSLWARTVYDFALAYHLRVMNREHLLSAFTPLYAGWLGSWIGEMVSAREPDVEARIEQLCLQYEVEKPYFISGWRSPDRFNP